ncbi:beta-ketoacyl-ACP synthase III [Rubrivirga marina]|uniref:Beta-ketoacyl-[acyl-carrier-protein] synthase III n=1 Tax=Rubrivirga marina TaxID=1196024 RepID=A0A271IVV8_9BACT|nr:beta-ketoacyl-ACP synthase III [Rubrivirga marina]PAP75257.1 3-oxoacyl-ACP synthase [Rubrivirga marina]
MPQTTPTAAITAVGKYLPPDRLTNADLEKLVDTNDEWIRTRTGIEERRILKDPTKATSDMAVEAARECLAKAGVAPTEVDCILVATVTPDMVFPATACLVQTKLGATNAWGYDISAACSGFLYALTTGAKMIEAGMHQKVLVIGADAMTRIIDYTDRTTCVIFGDGAGAVLLEPRTDGTGVLDTVQYADGTGVHSLSQPGGGSLHPATHETVDARMHYAQQDGRAVFKRAVTGMADAAAEIMERNDLSPEDVRYLVPHQANLRIIDATARRMGLTDDKVMINIARYGNTTAGTLPLCLADWENQLRAGDNLVLAAFGGGFTWGATWLKWSYDGAR